MGATPFDRLLRSWKESSKGSAREARWRLEFRTKRERVATKRRLARRWAVKLAAAEQAARYA
jgi:hypothetical protein